MGCSISWQNWHIRSPTFKSRQQWLFLNIYSLLTLRQSINIFFNCLFTLMQIHVAIRQLQLQVTLVTGSSKALIVIPYQNIHLLSRKTRKVLGVGGCRSKCVQKCIKFNKICNHFPIWGPHIIPSIKFRLSQMRRGCGRGSNYCKYISIAWTS